MSQASVNDRSTATVQEQHLTSAVTSEDGTTIGYRHLGHGPGVVVVHGAMESAQSHIQLAEALAENFTVYLVDRRGRGLSGPYGTDHCLQKDVQDLDALLTRTGAHNVLGVSSGALICLQAALTLPVIRKAAIFEPPLFINESPPTALMNRFDEEMAQGKVASALITGMKAAQMGPAIFNLLPRWPLERLTEMAMANEDRKAKPGDVSMRALAATLHYDFQLIAESAGTLESFKNVPAEVLLLGGTKSPTYLRAAVDALEKVLPHVTRVEFPGLGHGATGNANRGGRPQRVAIELRKFFA